MYKRNNWDEDKWDIHKSSGGSGYAAGHNSGNESYHSGSGSGGGTYNSGSASKEQDMYNSAKADDHEKEKKEELSGPSIDDTLKDDKKYDAKEKQEESAKTKQQDTLQFPSELEQSVTKKKDADKSIETAIDSAIKKEKNVHFVS